MTGRVIVVGSINIDLVVTGQKLPAPGETVIGGRFAQHHGGKGGNQAVAAARLGAPVAFIGAVGDDDFGRSARDTLAAEGIDVSQIRTLADQATGVALILVDADGENSISVASGANGAVTPEQVAGSIAVLAPGPGDVVLVGHEIPTAAVASALRAAGERGATTILNPAPASGLDAETVALAELVTPNEGELTTLHEAGVSAERIIVSLGSEGAELRTADGTVRIPALPVTAIDSVGAGDTLNGALAASLAAGYPLEEAARRAVAAASLAVTKAGAREGMPTRGELEAAVARIS
jgi:ribokinase